MLSPGMGMESPCPELMLLPWRQLLARQKGGGGMSSLLSAVALWPSWAAASESNGSCPFVPAIISLVCRQRGSVRVIFPNTAAVSESLPCTRHRSQPCPCSLMLFNPPLSLLCRYYSLDILKITVFNSGITEYTILQFSFINWGAVISMTALHAPPHSPWQLLACFLSLMIPPIRRPH